MLIYFGEMRAEVLFQIASRKIYNNAKVSGAFISSVLLLPDMADCFNCLVGFGFNPDENSCDFDPQVRLQPDDWRVKIKKFRQ
jgi:hypothetical protein